jgi:hypothetical protein
MPAVPSPQPDPAPANRAARRAKATKLDPGTGRYRSSDGPARPARPAAQGRRVIPIRRTG